MAMRPDAPAGVHASGYARRDFEVVDYAMQELAPTGLAFRGPFPPSLEPGAFFACLGAAQTFGCFCEDPFPTLLARRLGLPALNLGYGGAGPAFFLAQPALLEIVNHARFVVLQVMSARSESNARFESGGLEYVRRRSDGVRLGAEAAWRAELDGLTLLPGHDAPWLRWGLRRVGRLRARRLVVETRRNWVESTRRLAEAIRVPTVLLWFSQREPRYRTSFRTLGSLFSEFPHLVDEPTLAAAKQPFATFVRCVTRRGSPQLLRSRFTGAPCTVDPSLDRPDLGGEQWTHNHYYPSPEMHADAAEALLVALGEDLSGLDGSTSGAGSPRAR